MFIPYILRMRACALKLWAKLAIFCDLAKYCENFLFVEIDFKAIFRPFLRKFAIFWPDAV